VKYLLGQVGSAGVVKPVPPAAGVDQRGVGADEIAPREAVVRVADAKQRAGARRTRRAHDRSGTGRLEGEHLDSRGPFSIPTNISNDRRTSNKKAPKLIPQ
jgi:hypothetical protein